MTTYASPEAWWSEEMLSGGKGLVRIWGRHGIDFYYPCPGQGGRCNLSVSKEESKRGVGTNSE